MQIPFGMHCAFQGSTRDVREVAGLFRDAGIRHVTGPLPGG